METQLVTTLFNLTDKERKKTELKLKQEEKQRVLTRGASIHAAVVCESLSYARLLRAELTLYKSPTRDKLPV